MALESFGLYFDDDQHRDNIAQKLKRQAVSPPLALDLARARVWLVIICSGSDSR